MESRWRARRRGASLTSSAIGGRAAWRQEEGVGSMGARSTVEKKERGEDDRGGPPVRVFLLLPFYLFQFKTRSTLGILLRPWNIFKKIMQKFRWALNIIQRLHKNWGCKIKSFEQQLFTGFLQAVLL